MSNTPPEFVLIYDTSDPCSWEQAQKDRHLWGKLYTGVYFLEADRVVLSFYSAGPRWQRWEAERKEMLFQFRERCPARGERCRCKPGF